MTTKVISKLSALMMASAVSCVALQASAQELISEAAYRIVEISETGEEILVERGDVRPGEIIEYTLTHMNNAEFEMDGLSIFAPVPEGVTLALGSEFSSMPAIFEIQAEIDPELEGLEWSTLPAMRTVIAADGTKSEELVPADAIAAVRWNLESALEGGETALNTYRVVVN